MNTQRLADMCLSDNPFVRAEGCGKLRALLQYAHNELRAIAGGVPSPAYYAKVAADCIAADAAGREGILRAGGGRA